ncbi:EI24 domain-containing protein [Myxosarcina sp. GI1]|uniref:EI24 domain-containing protein n=1 Tax=Myxosarcina sp. GI1 TaxID=1541065 RepID=UPI000ACF7238|nr:EI24 domain-containing protein [Myxosarcina sp. GI1]
MGKIIRKILGGFGTLSGASYPLRALLTFKRHPRLWKFIAVPILVNFVVAIALYGGLLFFGWQIVNGLEMDLALWLDRITTNLPQWLSFLEYAITGLFFVLRFILIIILLVATGFVLTQFGVLLGAPWYGQLSEQLEKIRTGKVEIIEINIVSDLGRAILYELKKLVLIAIVGIPLLVSGLFPGVGTVISTVGSFILTVTIVSLDFLDSPLERRRLRFRHKLSIVGRSLPASATFGVVCLGLISIPLVNLVTIPLCVASGTLFVCDRILPRLPRHYFLKS